MTNFLSYDIITLSLRQRKYYGKQKNGFRNVALALIFASTIALASGAVLGYSVKDAQDQMDQEVVSICNKSDDFAQSQQKSFSLLQQQLSNNQISKQEYDAQVDYYNSLKFKHSVVYSLEDVDTTNLDSLFNKKDILQNIGTTALSLGVLSGVGGAMMLKKHSDEERAKMAHNQKINELLNISQEIDEKGQ